jgi:3-deoxy-D-manno-octulosonic-acid transferase
MPSTVLALVLFFCFVTPGLVFELLQERSRPARQYSALRETSIIVVASVGFTLPAAIIILLVRLAARPWFPDFYELAVRPAQYSASHLPQVIGFIVELVLLAVGFAWIADHVLRRRHPPHAVIRNNPTWFEMIDGRVRPEDTKAVIVSAELKNGASIQGAVKAHESGKDQALAWLVLRPHSAIKFGIRNPDGTFVDVPTGWAYTVIAGDDIRSANIAYVKSET